MRYICPLLFFPVVVAAQSPVIGTAQFFQPGPTYARDTYVPSTAFSDQLAQAGGPDYAIDLTPVNAMFMYGTEHVVRVPTPPEYAFFSDYYDTANVLINIYMGQGAGFCTHVFRHDAGELRHVGGQPNGATWMLELAFMQYPDSHFPLELEEGMTYGFTHTDTLDGSFVDASGSDWHYQRGTRTIEADGYGTVTMPDGVAIENTLRLRDVVLVTDSNDLFGVNELQDTTYTWYAEGISGPLMTLSRSGNALTAGYVSTSTLAVYHQAGLSAVPSIAAVPSSLHIAPNPTSGLVRITAGHSEPQGTLTLLDPLGRTVRQWPFRTSNMELDLSDLASGQYGLILQDRITRSVGALRIIR